MCYFFYIILKMINIKYDEKINKIVIYWKLNVEIKKNGEQF